MWSSSKDTDRTQKVPSVFENFNPYDILEPEKVNHKKNDDVSTAVLIEIDDNTDKCDNTVDLTLHGSLLDRLKKSEYDLLDLFQNIYVTPQEIKKKGDFKNQSSSLNNNIKDTNIDFTQLFEKAEHGQKLSEWKEYDINSNNTVKEISVPNLIKNANHTVEGMPKPSFIQKSTTSNDDILDNAISVKCTQLNLQSNTEPKMTEPEPEPICEDEIDEFIKPKLKDPSSFKELTPLASGKPDNDIICALSLNRNGNRSSHTIENKMQFSSKIEPKLHVTPIHHTHAKSSLTHLNSPPHYRLACQQECIPMLYTMKLDPKVYNSKRRIVREDREIVGLTKGPDIFEKSIVLPQIMKRLTDRKRVFDERKSMQAKFMLDTGEKQSYDEVKINNAVAQTSKHINAKPKNSFEPYLIPNSLKHKDPVKLAYQTAKGFCKQDNLKKLLADETVNEFNDKEPSKHLYQMAAGFVNEPSKQVAYHKVASCNPHETNKLVACQKVDALVKPKISLKPPDYYLEPEKSVNFEPKILLEDCNAKRIIALKTRIALEKLVKTGKLPP